MLETDPVQHAHTAIVAAAEATLRGGDPNQLRPALARLLTALGQGKRAKEVMALPPLLYVKPKVRR